MIPARKSKYVATFAIITALLAPHLVFGQLNSSFYLHTAVTMEKPELESRIKSPVEWFEEQNSGLSKENFKHFLTSLFTDFDNGPYEENGTIALLFKTFDEDCDGQIGASEFRAMWKKWVELIICPRSALIIVDVQNDFISGKLSVRNVADNLYPELIVPVINNLTAELPWTLVVYTQDWHPDDHISFYEKRKEREFHAASNYTATTAKKFDTVRFVDNRSESGFMEQRLWPKHAVQNTWGAQLHKDLIVINDSITIRKGMDSDVDSYSAFYDNQRRSETPLRSELQKWNITDVFVSGIAYDVCVMFTALHAMELGYRTVIVDDASCGTSSAATNATKFQLGQKHCMFPESSQVKKMVLGKERPLKLGLQLADAIKRKP